MIGRIKGIIVDKEADGAIVDVAGVGYHISLPLNTLATLPPLNAEVTLSIHTHVREEEIRLFGFETKQDRTAFRTLLKISGVGPKVALAVIGGLNGSQLVEAVQNSDTKRLCTIPGIGKKSAERMILELGGKLDFINADGEGGGLSGIYSELDSALKNLGFKGPQVQKVLEQIKKDFAKEDSFPVLLKMALGSLQKK